MPKLPTALSILVGRHRETAELAVGLDELSIGRGSLFLLTGEPGIGKTRLADEATRAAAARGYPVHWGRAWEAGGAPSFWPFVQLLRSILRGLPPAEAARLVRPHELQLAQLLPELRASGHTDPSEPSTRERFQLFDSVNALLHAAAARSPQVLVLDDLHAADPSSLLLLHFLVRDLRTRPLMVIGTYREAEARLSPEIGATLTQVAREACVLPLRRLAPDEVAELVARSDGTPASAERIEALHRDSEGNPLFLRELLQLQASMARRPAGIREVVRARLSLLTPPVRRVLEAAAVLGREFDVESVTRVLDEAEDDVAQLLEPACDAAIVEPLAQASRFRFSHFLLREGLYQGLVADRRAELHRSAAAMLRCRATGTPLAELAHHLLHAIPTVALQEAAEVTLRAAESAMEVLAFEDASALLTRAAKWLEGAAGQERWLFEVWLALGAARIRAADVAFGKSVCRRAAELARRLGDGELFARAVLGSAYEFSPGVRNPQLIALLEEALVMLPAGDGSLRARCMAQLAAERQPEADTQPPVALAREAVDMARRLGDQSTLRSTLTAASLAMMVYAEPAERMAVNREVLRLAMAAADKRVALRAHLLVFTDCWEQGDMAGAGAHSRAYEALAQEFPHDSFHWISAGIRAADALSAGRFQEAEEAYRLARELAQRDQTRGTSLAATPAGFCCATERYDDIAQVKCAIRAAFASMSHELGGCIGEMLIAEVHARAGHVNETAAQLAVVRGHPSFAAIREPAWLALLTDACHLLEDVPLAEMLYPALLPRAERFFNLAHLGPYNEPPYSRRLGLLAQTLGRTDEAVAHLAHAEAKSEEAGLRAHLARVRFELAGALLVRARAGDRERAICLLEQALALARELEQRGLLQRMSARLDAARACATEAAAAPAPRVTEDRLDGKPFAIRREGEYWTVVHRTGTLRLRDSRGMQVLASLLASPGHEFHVLQLVSAAEADADRGDAGAVLDDKAVHSYRRRLLDLREQLEEAESFGDPGRAARAREEMGSLTSELARAVWLGGRERRSGGAAERARTAVQKRLRGAIQRIDEGLPDLGRYLDQTIRTGMFCGYLPEGRVRARRR